MNKPNDTKAWEGLDWTSIESKTFKLQCRIFEASKSGNTELMRNLQRRLFKSLHARCMAVRKVAQINSGRNTAGPDGMKSLTSAQKYRLALSLTLEHRPSAPKRIEIPKRGKTETRPLSIPNMSDRAHQEIIKMALEPEWEAKFDSSLYGFRKGRSTADALSYTRMCVERLPKYVLDADIKSFFDNIDHDALISTLGTYPALEQAIYRILKTNSLNTHRKGNGTEGTPQGGPLSPLLANIVMTGLKDALTKTYAEKRKELGIKSYKAPYVVVYADDLVVIHEELKAIEWAKEAVAKYLHRYKLQLHPEKTKIRHTLDEHFGQAPGIDFLGVHVQQHKTGKYAPKHYGKQMQTLLTPSKESMERFRQECSHIIKGTKLSGKHRQARRDRSRKGIIDPVSLMITRLNKLIKGWVTYYKPYNSKKSFSKLDHYLFQTLWHWAIRQFPRKKRQWLIDRLFSGIELDKKGHPLKRLDGTPRERKWAFTSPFVKDGRNPTLHKLADTAIQRRNLVIGSKSVYDGDWAYWSSRQGYYPTIPKNITSMMKYQRGKCHLCNTRITSSDRVTIQFNAFQGKPSKVLTHKECAINQTQLSTCVRSLTPTHDSSSAVSMETCTSGRHPSPSRKRGVKG